MELKKALTEDGKLYLVKQEPRCTIYNADCLEQMKLIPDKSVNMVLMDPPYNIKKDKDWDNFKTVNAYVEFMGKVFKECERVLVDNGSMYWFHNDFLQIIELQNWISQNTNFIFKQFITWNKIHESFKNYGYVQQRLSIDAMRNYYNGFTEYCLYYTFQDETGLTKINSNTSCYRPIKDWLIQERNKTGYSTKQLIDLSEKYLGKKNTAISHYFSDSQFMIPTKEVYEKFLKVIGNGKAFQKEYEALRKEYEALRYTYNVAIVKEDLRANSNVWLYPPAPKTGHLTPKPVEMLENIINHSTNEGMIVLDPFIGSGSTGVACINTNRKFIGIEKDGKYFNTSWERLQETLDR